MIKVARVGFEISDGFSLVQGIQGEIPVEPEECPLLDFSAMAETNATIGITGNSFEIVGTSGEGGIAYAISTVELLSATGKVSIEMLINSLSEGAIGTFDFGFWQGEAPVAMIGYQPIDSSIEDRVAVETLVDELSPVIGEFWLGITLDFEAETATYSYKLSNAASAVASAPITCNLDNTLPVSIVIGAEISVDKTLTLVLKPDPGTFVTAVDGLSYCFNVAPEPEPE